jgi:hypothetical protein
MIKAIASAPNGRKVLVIGLTFGNLDRFRAQPHDTNIRIDGKEIGLPVDVMIFSSESDAAAAHMMGEFIGPDTKVHIDPKLKS